MPHCEADESIEHAILECSGYDNERTHLLQGLDPLRSKIALQSIILIP